MAAQRYTVVAIVLHWAIALAQGISDGGRDGAREMLYGLWWSISRIAATPVPTAISAPGAPLRTAQNTRDSQSGVPLSLVPSL